MWWWRAHQCGRPWPLAVGGLQAQEEGAEEGEEMPLGSGREGGFPVNELEGAWLVP